MARALARGHRVIAPDLPGFGASSKPVHTQYSFGFFGRTLDAFVSQLGLRDVGLVVHDLGDPIGVHWALHSPVRVSCLALLNTLLYPEFSAATRSFVASVLDPGRREALVSPGGLSRRHLFELLREVGRRQMPAVVDHERHLVESAVAPSSCT